MDTNDITIHQYITGHSGKSTTNGCNKIREHSCKGAFTIEDGRTKKKRRLFTYAVMLAYQSPRFILKI
jgi:hypothetical protein